MSNLETEQEKKRRVAIYIRVSTAEQKIEGYSMETQERRLLEHVKNNVGLKLETRKEWIFRDVHTGSDLNRPALSHLREEVKKGKFDAVLVWKIDRLSRNLKHLITIFEELQNHGVSFISIQENIDFKGPIGQLIFQIFGAIAQFERELIKGRTYMGKLGSAEVGNYTGTSIPYGYRKVKNPNGKGSRLEIISEEKQWVRQIYDWYIYEEMGEGQIAKKLNDLKVPKTNHLRTTRAGVKWTTVMVRTILMNPLYHGDFVANQKDEEGNLLPREQWTVVAIPACISEFTFQQAQEARRRHFGGTPATDYLLTGKLIDVDLERPKVFSGARRFKGGFSYRRKQFNKKGHHYSVFEIPGKPIEDFVWGKIMEALKDPEVFIKNYLSKEYMDPTRTDRIEQQLSTLRERKINEELAIARVEHAYEEGQYSEEKMGEKIADRNKEIAVIGQKIQDLEDELMLMSTADVEVKKLRDAAEQVRYHLDNLDRKQKKILCGLFVERVEMGRRKVHGRWKVRSNVFFRFNPSKFSEQIERDRTVRKLVSAVKGQLEKKNVVDGGRPQT